MAGKKELEIDALEVTELDDEDLEGVSGGANSSCSGAGPNSSCSGCGPNDSCSGPGSCAEELA